MQLSAVPLALLALACACASGPEAASGQAPPPEVMPLPIEEALDPVLPSTPEPAVATDAARWTPGPAAAFEILHFDELAEFRARLRTVDVVTLELEEIEAAGGRAVTGLAHGQGMRVICYTSSGFEDWRADAGNYPEDAKGSSICRDDACTSTWPGEAWGDIRKPSLLAFLGLRADRASAAGCDGIEFDNMDPAFNRTGLDMTADENLAAALELAKLGHERGLAVVAKNTGELARALGPAFDGVFVEQCAEYAECDLYLPYRGKLVAMVEYGPFCTLRDWAACNEQVDYFDADSH